MQQQFKELLEILARLRGPEGCPWDRAQTLNSMRSCLLEETWEVLDAIEHAQATKHTDFSSLKEELGDLLLNVLLLADIADAQAQAQTLSSSTEEQERHIDFNEQHFLAQLISQLCQKLTTRHPHVFGPQAGQAANPEEALEYWQKAKDAEAAEAEKQKAAPKTKTMVSALSTVVRDQTALLYANKLQKKAAKSGFDWPPATASQEVGKKIQEELQEFYHEANSPNETPQKIEEELGDILFSVVNLARVHSINPELALMRSSEKFRTRFQLVEGNATRPLSEMKLEELEQLWQQAKRLSGTDSQK